GLPAIYGSYILSSGKTGKMLAVVDGGELTARRTADDRSVDLAAPEGKIINAYDSELVALIGNPATNNP
ncbi:hypothetical protein, partial [Sphingomonas psychrolutea]|uniref:hypothetical protein n=1 Tax=Sphingomonas psychrolutea TaxID=1259676 RepID=UPI0025470B5E